MLKVKGVYNNMCFSPDFLFHFFVLEKSECGSIGEEFLYIKYETSHIRER